MTPLYISCRNNRLDIIDLLLTYPNIKNENIVVEYLEPLLQARLNNQSDIIKLLLIHNIYIGKKTLLLDNEIINSYLKDKNIIYKWMCQLVLNYHVKLFLLIVGLCDNFFNLKENNSFLYITTKLPLELQMRISHLVYRVNKQHILSLDIENCLKWI